MNAVTRSAVIILDPPSQSAARAAKRVGWLARKSRWRVGTIDNHGGFAIIDPLHNIIICGWQFDLTAEDVIEICRPDTEG